MSHNKVVKNIGILYPKIALMADICRWKIPEIAGPFWYKWYSLLLGIFNSWDSRLYCTRSFCSEWLWEILWLVVTRCHYVWNAHWISSILLWYSARYSYFLEPMEMCSLSNLSISLQFWRLFQVFIWVEKDVRDIQNSVC